MPSAAVTGGVIAAQQATRCQQGADCGGGGHDLWWPSDWWMQVFAVGAYALALLVLLVLFVALIAWVESWRP